MEIKSRKHWYSFTGNSLLVLFIGIPMLIFYFTTKESTEIHPYFRNGILILGIWILYKTIKGMILNSRLEWLFENDTLMLKSGLLPWKRTLFAIDISQIYDAYYEKSFLGTMLGYGNLHIRRTDGVTSKTSEFTINNHKKMISQINNSLNIYKKKSQSRPEQIMSKASLSDELRKLADLNKDGVISDQEFQILKNRMIQ